MTADARSAKPLSELLAPDWAQALAPVAPVIAQLGDFLRAEVAAGRRYLPAGAQDPYPTPGHAMGLSFSVAPDVAPIPRSLANIYTEYCDDLDYPRPSTGDLTPWADAGVLLLNRVLTVGAQDSGSHRGRGWEAVTECAIKALAGRAEPLVAILWGRDAQKLQQWLPGIPVIASAHPSPLSASRGFFGSRPFSRANAALAELGAAPVDWRLP